MIPQNGRHRGEVDDPPVPAPHHEPQRMFGAQERAPEIDPLHLVPVLDRHLDEEPVPGDGRVVDEGVQAS